MNHEKHVPIRYDNQPPLRLTRLGRGVFKAVGVGVSLAAAFGTVKSTEALDKATEYHPIATARVTVNPGETLIGTVDKGVSIIAKQHGFDADKVPGEIAEAQEVGGEIEELTGKETVDPGTTIGVTVSKNDFDQYKVEADPADFDN